MLVEISTRHLIRDSLKAHRFQQPVEDGLAGMRTHCRGKVLHGLAKICEEIERTREPADCLYGANIFAMTTHCTMTKHGEYRC